MTQANDTPSERTVFKERQQRDAAPEGKSVLLYCTLRRLQVCPWMRFRYSSSTSVNVREVNTPWRRRVQFAPLIYHYPPPMLIAVALLP